MIAEGPSMAAVRQKETPAAPRPDPMTLAPEEREQLMGRSDPFVPTSQPTPVPLGGAPLAAFQAQVGDETAVAHVAAAQAQLASDSAARAAAGFDPARVLKDARGRFKANRDSIDADAIIAAAERRLFHPRPEDTRLPEVDRDAVERATKNYRYP
jgi:hypothetical protein